MRNSNYPAAAVAIVLLALLLLAGGTLTQAGSGYRVDWWTVDGGGGPSSAAQLSLSGTVGQPDAGALSGDTYELRGGFWTAAPPVAGPPEQSNTISLPLIVNGN